jgi:ATP-dependent 26S proteasome regulatory subunit
MYYIKSYDIFTWWFSDPNIMLDTIFKSAIDKKEPCIIFLDEIESFIWWYAWSPYQNLIENTIRHHISKIKESDAVDIIIIWAISEKNKISPSLLKQDVFSKQIYFDNLPENRCVDFINKLAAENSVTIWSDVDVTKLVSSLKDHDRNQEYIKKLMNIAIDSHKLNSWEEDDSVLSMEDFNEALKVMLYYSRSTSQNVWF